MVIPAGHVIKQGVAQTKTCTQDGWAGYEYCTECDYTTKVVIPAGHVIKQGAAQTKTCTQDGWTAYEYCTECDYTTKMVIPAGHVIKQGVAQTKTCTQDGWTAYDYCTECDYTTKEIISATGHTEVIDKAVAATCTASGLSEGKHCSKCDEAILSQEEIPALGHKYSSVITKLATCTEAGELTYTCVNCGDSYIEGIPVLGHDYKAVVTAPTCTKMGYTIYTCACGDKKVVDPVSALGHTVVIDKAIAPTCTATGLTEGEHCFVCGEITKAQEIVPVIDHADGNGDSKCDTCGMVVGDGPDVLAELSLTRISGKGRSETAVQAAAILKAELGVSQFDRIIIANGLNFADALAGSYLAAVKSAPILLYSGAASIALNEACIKENLSADGVVYLLGGSAAVPDEVENSLKASGIKVERLKGKDRYKTNLEILKEAGVQPGSEILVATGLNFADSLSASATGKPILLVNGKGSSLSADQREYLTRYGGGKITILGGNGAVSAGIEGELRGYGEVKRLSGKTRYNTSTKIAEEYFGVVDTVVIAYGNNFPDGLCGGPVAYAMNAPLILTQAGQESVAAAYISDNPVLKGCVLGGTAAISEDTVKKLFQKESTGTVDPLVKLQKMAALGIDTAYNSAKFPSTLHLQSVTYEDMINGYGDSITRMVLSCYAANSLGGYGSIYVVVLCSDNKTDYLEYEWDGLYFTTSAHDNSPGLCDYTMSNSTAMDAYKSLISNPKDIPYD